MSDTAVILAGGMGTRLRPYTAVLPKPLMPIGDYPILELIIRQLAHYGIKNIVLAVNHQAELIRSYFGDGSKQGVTIRYSLETKRLSTMGPIKLIEGLPDNFIIMNGDVLTDLDYRALMDFHQQQGGIFTIASKQRESKIDYGVLEVSDQKLSGFYEKPVNAYDVSMGIYVASRSILQYIPEQTAYGFDELMKKMLEIGEQVNIYNHDGLWLDIGRPDDYMKAIDDFERDKELYLHE